MAISRPQTKSSSDIELPVLTSHSRSFQTLPPERIPLSPVSDTSPQNRTANHAVVHEIEPPTPAYCPPTNDTLPIPHFDADTRLHGHSETPLSSRQREDDRSSVQASVAHAEALPVYRADNPPSYSHSRHHSTEPTTWPTICFRLGFLFPLFWVVGALTLITPQGSLDRIFMPWFKDFAPDADSWRDNLQTEEEKEAYSARVRAAEIRWARMCLFAISLVLCLVIAAAVTLIGVTRVH